MKVLHVVTGLNVGGAETQLCGLIEGLQASGFDQKVVCLLAEGPLTPRIRTAGVECVHLGLNRGLPDIRGWHRLRKTIENYQPGILHAWMYHACIYSSLPAIPRRIPQLWGIHHSALEFEGNTISTSLAIMACKRFSFRENVHIAYCAEAARETHERDGYCPARSHFIPNGYDSLRFSRSEKGRDKVRAELGIPPDATVLGMVARFDPIKDHATFFEAAALLLKSNRENIVFLLIGEDIESSNGALMDLIAQSGLAAKVILAGRRKDIRDVYSALDLLVLSSRGEAFPNVICEAMLCELPCVSTRVGDCGDIIGDTGFLAAPGSPADLHDALSRSARLPARARRALGLKARTRIISRYSVESYISRHISIYGELTAPKSAPMETRSVHTGEPR